jgi:hypothetical protein
MSKSTVPRAWSGAVVLEDNPAQPLHLLTETAVGDRVMA